MHRLPLPRAALVLHLLAALCLAGTLPAQPPADRGRLSGAGWKVLYDSMVGTERAFSRASDARGINASFVEYLAEDGVVFRPRARPAREAYRSAPPTKAHLVRGPVLAGLSASGELGFTTGPYELRAERGKPVVRRGHYVTVWRRQPDGRWLAAIDIGSSHPDTVPLGAVVVRSLVRGRDAVASSALHADSMIATAAAKADLATALDLFGAEDLRLHREGARPATGAAAKRLAAEGTPGPSTWTPKGGAESRARDFAYTWGEYALAGGERGNYLRLWVRARDSLLWRVLLDVAVPVPPGTP